jgi:WXG100 family type VII secretion target
MSNVKVTYAEVMDVANKLAQAKQDLEQQLNQLRGRVQQLTDSGFVTDQAAPKFRASYEEWTKGTVTAIGGLEGMSSFLKEAVRMHQDLDTQLGQRVQG